ncbi:MAG: polysaccharide biosynthesis C-terminal domain-containing protein, partial [Phycisphaerae bacterium]
NVIAMLTGVLVARTLGPSGAGQSQLPLLINLFLGTVLAMGVGQATVYFINNRKVPIRRVTSTLLMFLAVWFPSSVLLTWSAYLLFPGFFGNLPVMITLFFCIGNAVNRMANQLVPVLLAEFRAAATAAMEVAERLAQIVAVTTLVLIGSLTVHSFLLCSLVSGSAKLLLALWLLRAHIEWSWRPDWSLIRGLIGYGLKLTAAVVALNAHLIAPAMLLRVYVEDFEPIGLYTRAIAVCALVSVVASATGPLLYSAWAYVDSDDRRARQVELAARLYSLLGLSAALVVALFSKGIITLLYGAAFAPAAGVLRILVFSMAMQIVANTFQNLFPAVGRPIHATLNVVATFMINVIGCVILIPRFGIHGAAAAYAIASFTYLLVTGLGASRVCGVRLSACFVPRVDDIRRIVGALRTKQTPSG